MFVWLEQTQGVAVSAREGGRLKKVRQISLTCAKAGPTPESLSLVADLTPLTNELATSLRAWADKMEMREGVVYPAAASNQPMTGTGAADLIEAAPHAELLALLHKQALSVKQDSELWAKSADLKTLNELASSETLRQQRSRGLKLGDRSFGVDEVGRIWRKENDRALYYVPSLRNKRIASDPLVRLANKLKSTVD